MEAVEEFLGLDIGSQRIGVARGSSAARMAEPIITLKAAEAVEKIKDLAKEHKAAGIVVGLPRSLEGNETEQTILVRTWVDAAKKSLNIPFYWQDEALTTHKALEAGADKSNVDALAAAIVLQDFLDGLETGRTHV